MPNELKKFYALAGAGTIGKRSKVLFPTIEDLAQDLVQKRKVPFAEATEKAEAIRSLLADDIIAEQLSLIHI